MPKLLSQLPVSDLHGCRAAEMRPSGDLSVEQLVECDGAADPVQRHADCGQASLWPPLPHPGSSTGDHCGAGARGGDCGRSAPWSDTNTTQIETKGRTAEF